MQVISSVVSVLGQEVHRRASGVWSRSDGEAALSSLRVWVR